MKTLTSHSEEETKKIAAELALSLPDGTIIALQGDLGAGKTTFTKGLAEGLGIKETLSSPTFTLMNVYQIPQPVRDIRTLVHIDTYRLEREQELLDIGAEDYLGRPGTISVIEWADKIPTILARYKFLTVNIDSTNPKQRTLTIS